MAKPTEAERNGSHSKRIRKVELAKCDRYNDSRMSSRSWRSMRNLQHIGSLEYRCIYRSWVQAFIAQRIKIQVSIFSFHFKLQMLLYPPLLIPVVVTQVGISLLDTGVKGLFTLSDPYSGIVVLLVGLVSSIGVTDLSLEVILLVLDKVTDTLEVCPLYLLA